MRDRFLIEKLMVEIINNSSGIKATELAVKAIEALQKIESRTADLPDPKDITDAMYSLSIKKRAIEIEYSVPRTPHRTKSIFFPIGTEFQNCEID